MKNKTYLVSALLLIFIISAFCAPVLSGSGYNTKQSDTFTLNNWAVDQELVQPKENVTIEGEVHNNGENGTDEEVRLFVNGKKKDSKDVFVGAGESKTVSFTHSEEEEGTYTVSVKLANYDDEWDDGEFQVKLVTDLEITPSTDKTITAGSTLDFDAEAYSGDSKISTDDTDFSWKNTDNKGIFDKKEAGHYEVSATYNGVSSTTVNVTVEPAEPTVLKVVQEPSDATITAGEKAEYTVQVRDEYGNEQTQGSFKIALEVEGLEPTRRHETKIEDGESEATLDWTATSGNQGGYDIKIIDVSDGSSQLDTAETTLTINEEESLLGGFWWSIPVVIVILVLVVLSYLWTIGKLELDLGGRRKPKTHEWKRNEEESNESSE